MTAAHDRAFAAFLDAIEGDEAYCLRCPQGHGSLPPQRVCPECQSRALSRDALPGTGEIVTYTVVSVPEPRFSDHTPYVTAIADFGPVNLTGQVRGADSESITVGQPVTLTIGRSAEPRERFVAFDLR